MMARYTGLFSNKAVLKACGLTRQGLAKARKARGAVSYMEQRTVEVVKLARQQAPRMGSRPIFYTYGVDFTGVNRFEKTVAKLGLTVAVKKKKKIQTTHGLRQPADANLINGLLLDAPRQVIVGDITYFWGRGRLYYIFTLKDAYSGLILGLTASSNLRAENAVKTLKKAFKLGGKHSFKGTVHHSDAGSQYKGNAYKKLLRDNNMPMSIADNCIQNGIAEQFNGLVKNDYLAFRDIANVGQLNRELGKLQHFLNNKRTVKGLGNRTPAAFELAMAALPAEKRMKKILYDFNGTEGKPP
jgi:putative transposase